MSKRFKYGVPLLVDLRAESATAATCDAFGGDASGYACKEGSCPTSSRCTSGAYAQWCYGTGSVAHTPSAEYCWSCCQAGTSVSAPSYTCSCPNGTGATWSCDTFGGNAGEWCSTGGSYCNCC
jgi:hypothetical protein